MKSKLSEEQISLEASAWVVREARGLSPEEKDERAAWLAADPRHEAWFARRRKEWEEFDGLRNLRPELSSEPDPDLLESKRPAARVRWIVWSAGLLAAAITIGYFLPRWTSSRTPQAASVVAAAAESRRLDDGSVVDLQAGAQLEIQYTPSERRVLLVQGEAQFQVAKNPRRPFVVEAGGVAVNAVGTAFNVLLKDREIEVAVMEGEVRVDPPKARLPDIGSVSLRAGQKLTVPFEGAWNTRVELLCAEEAAGRFHRTPAMLDFENRPLEEVAEAFNRQNRLRLIVADPTLKTMPIVASFRADNVEGFVRMLELSEGIRAVRKGDVIELRSGP